MCRTESAEKKYEHLISFFLVFLFFLIEGLSFGQEMYGFSGSNYSGITSAWLNPVSFLDSKYKEDINISGAEFFFDNNCFYLPKQDYKFKKFFQKNPTFPEYVDFYNNDKSNFFKTTYGNVNKSLFANIRYQCPGVAIRFKRSTFGIMTNIRYLFDIDKVPYHLMELYIDGAGYTPYVNTRYDSKPYDAGTMGLLETDLNYANRIFDNGEVRMGLGVNLKYLNSFTAAYVRSRKFDYIIPNKHLLQVFDLTGDYGYSLPVNRNTFGIDSSGFYSRGTGAGIDVGFSYCRTVKSIYYGSSSMYNDEDGREYKYKFSVSLIDLGFVNISKDAHVFSFNHDTAYWVNADSFSGKSIMHIDSALSKQFKGAPNVSESGSKFTMLLPLSAVIQFDFNPVNNFYINTTFLYGIKTNQPSLRHPSVLSLSIRYEKKAYGIYCPINYYNWTKLMMGVGFRIFSFFYAGTDNLGAFFHINDFTGLDFYCGFKCGIYAPSNKYQRKLRLFRHNKCPNF